MPLKIYELIEILKKYDPNLTVHAEAEGGHVETDIGDVVGLNANDKNEPPFVKVLFTEEY